nr:immunoglobulin heavy chain junction region [Macaca mulatta]MOX59977.1 immunoglobulin heavy chain junction region [Macaca mulatta]MOX60115.1 immunoglobulin heavy chain junction region [Macaca mulatta]MOX61180.1 immunoglobulin heavy chain junction region [Macaca mulatta]MOX61298.1 immunoglobulin heavy chain junction region [Macaca mulatta]
CARELSPYDYFWSDFYSYYFDYL